MPFGSFAPFFGAGGVAFFVVGAGAAGLGFVVVAVVGVELDVEGAGGAEACVGACVLEAAGVALALPAAYAAGANRTANDAAHPEKRILRAIARKISL